MSTKKTTIIEQIRNELAQMHEDDLKVLQWYIIYLQMTPAERLEMIGLMLDIVQSREAAIPA